MEPQPSLHRSVEIPNIAIRTYAPLILILRSAQHLYCGPSIYIAYYLAFILRTQLLYCVLPSIYITDLAFILRTTQHLYWRIKHLYCVPSIYFADQKFLLRTQHLYCGPNIHLPLRIICVPLSNRMPVSSRLTMLKTGCCQSRYLSEEISNSLFFSLKL